MNKFSKGSRWSEPMLYKKKEANIGVNKKKCQKDRLESVLYCIAKDRKKKEAGNWCGERITHIGSKVIGVKQEIEESQIIAWQEMNT